MIIKHLLSIRLVDAFSDDACHGLNITLVSEVEDPSWNVAIRLRLSHPHQQLVLAIELD